MKTIILIAVIMVAIFQFIHCETTSVSRGMGGLIGAPLESQSLPLRNQEVSSVVAHSQSSGAVSRSINACTCSGCTQYVDTNLNIYYFNSSCSDSRNFISPSMNIGSDNTAEMYQVYVLKSAEYNQLIAKLPFSSLSSLYANCISSASTVYDTPNAITAYYCDSKVANATTCATKYSYSSSCYIGLNNINATSTYSAGKLLVNVDLYGNDGKLWIRSASNVKVTVTGTSYSNSFTSKNLYLGSMVFTFSVPTTPDSYNIAVEAENYFGVVTKSLVLQNRSSGQVTLTFSGIVLMVAMVIFALF